MEAGFETIGNATLICYDRAPVLVTDPWIVGSAYFGSWTLSHEIPAEQMNAIKNCEYVWISHGHPDHLSVESLNMLRNKKILLPDHVGSRIVDVMRHDGFYCTILKDRVWTRLSPQIRVLCIADYNQDALLLVDVAGTLVVDLNDSSDYGWGHFVRNVIKNYEYTFLLKLFGYGDADMINFFDEDNIRIEPQAAKKLPVGKNMALTAQHFGVRYIVPFSSLHKYQRADSIWANEYTTPLDAYGIGFTSNRCELLPSFIRYDCLSKSYTEINPQATTDNVIDPKTFGDDWLEQLEKDEFRKIEAYFKSISHIQECMDYINFRIGGKDNRVEFRTRGFNKGITFEVPRHSLMQAIEFEIFDDLLIGNFMKTRLEGRWLTPSLYPDFAPYVPKYADNGRAKTPEELKKYFREYRRRAPLDYLRHRIPYRVCRAFLSHVKADTRAYQFARKTWRFAQSSRWI
jgi:hypothetical protein